MGKVTQVYKNCTRDATYTYSVRAINQTSGTNWGIDYTLNIVYSGCTDGSPAGPVPNDIGLQSGHVDVVSSETLSCMGPSAFDPAKNQCICAMNAKPSSDQKSCEAFACPPSGGYSPIVTPDLKVPNVAVEICTQGCSYKPGAYKAGADGQIWAVWPFKSTGSFCGGDQSAAGVDTGEKSFPPAPTPCGANMCPGTINGVATCQACKGTSVDGPSTSASGVQPGDPLPNPGDPASGVRDTSTRQECNGLTCTITTEYKNGAGQVIGSKTETKPQESFCKDNPTLAICKNSGWGGSCGGGFTCDGDAVQCALAQEVHKRNCEWADVDTAMKNRGITAMNGQAQPQGHPGNAAETTPMNFGSVIDQTDRLGGGCPVDDVITVGSVTVVIPWSRACGSLQLAGQLAVAACLLAAAFIMFGT